MVSAEPTVSLPATSVTSLIAASLRLINSSVAALPAEDLAPVLAHLQHTNAVVGHAIRRSNLTRARPIPLDPLDQDAQELLDLADELGSMMVTDDFEKIGASDLDLDSKVGATIAPATCTSPAPAIVLAAPIPPATASVTPGVVDAALATSRIGVNLFPIPGAYLNAPVADSEDWPKGWYVITRGTRVGIFTDWEEAGTYVIGVSGALHRMYKNWPQARSAYNRSLELNRVKIIR